jgi:hypothetical protein
MAESKMLNFMTNPRSFTLKKWLVELLKEKFSPHDAIADRVATALVTEKDMEAFGKLMIDVYEKGYLKAVEDYRTQFEKLGVRINVVAERPNSKSQD